MAGQNDFLLWGTDSNANVLTQAQYAALTNRTTGVVAGKASAQQANKAWRQASIISRMISQFIIDTIPTADALDNGTIATLETNFIAAIAKTFSIPNTTVVPGTYPQANLTVQADGRLTFAGSGRNANYALDLGTIPNVYIANLNPAPANLAALNGVPIWVKFAHSNTGASTLNVNGFGAIPITYAGGSTNVLTSALYAGVVYGFVYDGTSFQLVAAQPLRPVHGSQYFATPGAIGFTVPAEVYQVYAELWGGGAGGSGGGATPGGSGGAGAYTAGWVPVTPGLTVGGTVGAAGSGAFGGAQAGNGGTTTFGSLSAPGGVGAATGAGAGGPVGAGGIIMLRGGQGQDLDAPTNGIYSMGSTAVATGGSSPRGGFGGNMNAAGVVVDATAPGGGGGANSAASRGADGAPGGINVFW